MSLVFNGKALELTERVFTKLKSICLPFNEKEKTLVSQGDVPVYNTHLVIRTVEKPWTDGLSDEQITHELEQRILHYAIVPQVAYHRNEQTVSYVSPYLRGGSLDKAISKETESTPQTSTEVTADKPQTSTEVTADKPQTLTVKEKIRVLFQICCAIEYLHNPQDCDRKAVTHGNITMKKVLFDEQKNARLLFFEPKSDKAVGEKQFTEDKHKDVQDFKEMWLQVLDGKNQTHTVEIPEDIQTAMTMEEIKRILESFLRNKGISRWTSLHVPGESKHKQKCDICCVNEPEQFCKELQPKSCPTNIQVCVGCLSTWQYNPIKCHSCNEPKIQSPVGDGWGALLIAGDVFKKDGPEEVFKNDIKKMQKEVITNATIMGVREKNTVVVEKNNIPYLNQLEEAFKTLRNPNISTLVLVYSGHHGITDGKGRFQLETKTSIDDDYLTSEINAMPNIKKVILFLDCCHLEKFNKEFPEKVVLQFNAVERHQEAAALRKGSIFTKNVISALTTDIDRSTIRNDDLADYLSNKGNTRETPTNLANTGAQCDRIVTFRTHTFNTDKLDEELKKTPLLGLKTKLIQYILDNYSTLPLNPIVQHQDSLLVDFYEPPEMTKTVLEKDKDGKQHTVQKSITKIEDLFITECKDAKEPSYINRVYISGEAGMGKTSFSHYLALAWCAVHGESVTCERMREIMKEFKLFNDIQYLKQTDLLFLLHLREFEKEYDCKRMLSTYLHTELGYSDNDVIELFSHINSQKKVILMDGLDEWKCTANKIPKYGSLSKVNIVCTSRPWKIDSCVTAPMKDYNKITITGIGFNFVTRLVVNVTNCLKEEGNPVRDNTADFIKTLHSRNLRAVVSLNTSESQELLMIPVIILLLLCLWHDSKDFGRTRAQVYVNMTETLFRRMQKKKDASFTTRYTETTSPLLRVFDKCQHKCCRKVILNIETISRLAFTLLFNGHTEHSLMFRKSDLRASDQEMFPQIKQFCLNSGIIRGTSSKSSSCQDNIYSFIHKSYQEFFAALHVVAQRCDKSIYIHMSSNIKSLQDVVELANIFDFVCASGTTFVKPMVSLIDDLTTRHTMHTETDMKIHLIETIQNMIFAGCSSYVHEDQLSINLSNLIFRRREIKSMLPEEELMKLLKTNRCKINNNTKTKKRLFELTLNKSSFNVLYLKFGFDVGTLDLSQFDMEELALDGKRIDGVCLNTVQRLRRIEIVSNGSFDSPAPNVTVTVPFKDANKLTHLTLSNCSMSCPLDLSQCPLKELKLSEVRTEGVSVGCVEKYPLLDVSYPFDFTCAKKLTYLSITDCSLSGQLDLSQCPLKELELKWVKTERVIVGSVEKCTLSRMSCSFDFTNANKLTYLSITECSLSGLLDLSQCPLKELELKCVKTERVIVGCVEKCRLYSMSCSFDFTHANKLTNLNIKNCSIYGPLDLSQCPLVVLKLVKVKTERVSVGFVEECTLFSMSCSFDFTKANTLTNLDMKHCSISGQLDLSRCPLKKLKLDHVETERVSVGFVEECSLLYISCSFDFTNANKLTFLNMKHCSISGHLDLSQCPLKKLNLDQVETEGVIVGCVEKYTLLNMPCTFDFTPNSKYN